jgi:hypothetical protein
MPRDQRSHQIGLPADHVMSDLGLVSAPGQIVGGWSFPLAPDSFQLASGATSGQSHRSLTASTLPYVS